MVTWIEYRDRDHQRGLGQEVRGSIRAADGRLQWVKLPEVKAADTIVHLSEDVDRAKYFVGYSTAAMDADREGDDNVVPLVDFSRFEVRVDYDSFAKKHRKLILRNIASTKRPHYLPFQKSGDSFRIPQGYYFGVAPPSLKSIVQSRENDRGVSLRAKIKGKKARGNDRGPSGGGIKKATVWEARQYPLVIYLEDHLKNQGWREMSASVWWPDVLMEKNKHRILIEVKPEATTNNTITAIGQIICYRSPFDDNYKTLCIVASEGEPADELVNVMKNHQIKFLDLRRGWQKKLDAILSKQL
jgi:hypothetical protein